MSSLVNVSMHACNKNSCNNKNDNLQMPRDIRPATGNAPNTCTLPHTPDLKSARMCAPLRLATYSYIVFRLANFIKCLFELFSVFAISFDFIRVSFAVFGGRVIFFIYFSANVPTHRVGVLLLQLRPTLLWFLFVRVDADCNSFCCHFTHSLARLPTCTHTHTLNHTCAGVGEQA